MTDTYVIRRRKANGKGWEYYDEYGQWSNMPAAIRFRKATAANVAATIHKCEVCRMVPTVRWFYCAENDTEYGPLCHKPGPSAYADIEGPVKVIKRTTYRPEPVK